MADKNNFIFDGSTTYENVSASLKTNGVCMIQGYLDADRVGSLTDAVRKLAYAEHRHQLTEGECYLGRYSLKEVDELGIDQVGDIPSDDLLQKIATDFFRPYAADFRKIYCHHDVEQMAFNNAWHFDRGLTLKFFFYLNDVERENGAFWYDPGSHLANGIKQYLWWEAGTPILNYVPESEVRSPVPFEGPAGSLIIFDASGYHQAGEITNGGERWVLRYHVHSGRRGDGEDAAENPYARRNWEYRSQCYTTREAEKDDPWGLKSKNGSEAPASNGSAGEEPTSEVSTDGPPTPVVGRLKRLFSKAV